MVPKLNSIERSIEDLLKDLPPVIEYYTNEGNRFPIKQYANLQLEAYGDSWAVSYREDDYGCGQISHIWINEVTLKDALISVRKAVDKLPSKFEKFRWITESEIERQKPKEQL